MKTIFKPTLLSLVLLTANLCLNAQIGIGTNAPDTSVILEIKSTNKGILIPRVDDVQSANKVKGSLLYDKATDKFKFYDGTQWLSVNPLKADADDNVTAPKNLVVSGNSTIEGTAQVNGSSLSLPNATSLNAPNAVITGYGTIPIGGIIMWSGPNEPGDGWALCNGQTKNGIKTPNLSGRFIMASDSLNSDVLSIGGNDSIELTADQLPKHNHGAGALITEKAGNHRHIHHGYRAVASGGDKHVQSNNYMEDDPAEYGGDYAGEHTHPITGVTAYTGGIYHPEQFHTDTNGSPDQYMPQESCPAYKACISACKGDANCLDNCDNYVYPNQCENPDYNPNYGEKVIDVPESWNVQPIDIRPMYYVLAFIMRVK